MMTFGDELHAIAVPTVVAWGDADTALPREDQEALARLIRGARLVVHPGAGHMFYWDDPVRVADDLVAFVDTLAAGNRSPEHTSAGPAEVSYGE